MRFQILLFVCFFIGACGAPKSPSAEDAQPLTTSTPEVLDENTPFGKDLAFMRKHDPELVVLQNDNTYLITSAKYQGKVFTTTNKSPERPSFGYINRKAFGLDTPAEHVNVYGSENRLWLGPEAGPHALFFKPGTPFNGDTWYTPAAIDHEPWGLVKQSDATVVFEKDAEFTGRQGTTFQTKIDREVELLGQERIKEMYQYDSLAMQDLSIVGYSTRNKVTNIGEQAWTRESGTICLWLLDMLPAGDQVEIVMPFESPQSDVLGGLKRYFGAIPDDRLKATSKAVYLRGDGKFKSKIGLPPSLAGNRIGSLDLEHNVLTVVFADVEPNATYLAMQWSQDIDPYDGDAITAYNDVGEDDGNTATFYEVESIAPAAFLKPGESSVHIHTVYHFTGEPAALVAAAQALLGYEPGVLD